MRLAKVSALALINLFSSLAFSHVHRGTTEYHPFRLASARQHETSGDDVLSSLAHSANNISVPVDHFHNDSLYEPHSDQTFPLRYWFDARHYRKGGPVFVLAGGETNGEDRIKFLKYGILDILAEATGGVGVILEHRYYGLSYPVPDLSVENMRFLSTEQALADADYFARNIKFPGLEHLNLTAPSTPYIIYGGSYAGAFAAFARKLYPETFWGAIASSAVTEAVVDYWEYYEAARRFAPGECSSTIQKLTHVVDNILSGENRKLVKQLKDAFGLGELQDDDFASTIARGISGLQGQNWDPVEDYPDFGTFCAAISSNNVLYASTRHLLPTVQGFVRAGGYSDELEPLANRMLNYIGTVRSFVIKDLRTWCKNKGIVECYSARGRYKNIGLDQGAEGDERSWVYQTCTQWGYFQTGSGVPKDQLPLISRLIDLNYTTIACREAFNITKPPNIESINKLGGLQFRFPRVAFVDGEVDPWRAVTPHRIGLPERRSSTSEPFILIEHGVHHWDENGARPSSSAFDGPPSAVAKAQKDEVAFTMAWLEQWKRSDEEDWSSTEEL